MRRRSILTGISDGAQGAPETAVLSHLKPASAEGNLALWQCEQNGGGGRLNRQPPAHLPIGGSRSPDERNPFFRCEPDRPLPIGLVAVAAVLHVAVIAALLVLIAQAMPA